MFVHKPSKCGECVTFHNAIMITQESGYGDKNEC